jgi:flagellar basal body rod protein FlgG
MYPGFALSITAIASASLDADQRQLAVTSHNLANAASPGFKRSLVVSDVEKNAFATLVDPAAGALKKAAATAVAIDGAAFFELAGAQGPLYTRQGDFHINAAGRLVVGDQDLPVNGDSGAELVLAPGAFEVRPNGQVVQDGRTVGTIKLVRFDHPAQLTHQGKGLYAAGSAHPVAGETSSTLRTGFIEQSNVSTSQEMVSLTATVRHFEAMQKVVQGWDDAQEKAIRRLGDF